MSAALAPTDPVFASALVGREEVPRRLRHLLNVESGLNDGLALPVVVTLLALASRDRPHLGSVLGEVALGPLKLRVDPSDWVGSQPCFAPLENPSGANRWSFAIALLWLRGRYLTLFVRATHPP